MSNDALTIIVTEATASRPKIAPGQERIAGHSILLLLLRHKVKLQQVEDS